MAARDDIVLEIFKKAMIVSVVPHEVEELTADPLVGLCGIIEMYNTNVFGADQFAEMVPFLRTYLREGEAAAKAAAEHFSLVLPEGSCGT